MSVASVNPFAILDGLFTIFLSSDRHLIHLIVCTEDSSRPSTPPKPVAPEPSTQTQPATRGNQRGRGRGGPASRGGKYYQRGGTRGSGPRDAQPADEEPTEGLEKKCKMLLVSPRTLLIHVI
jgi:hypothetical protein